MAFTLRLPLAVGSLTVNKIFSQAFSHNYFPPRSVMTFFGLMSAYRRPFRHPDTLTTSNATAKSAAGVELRSFQKRSNVAFMIRPATDANHRIDTEERPEDTTCLACDLHVERISEFLHFSLSQVRIATCKFLLLLPFGSSPTARARALFWKCEHASDMTDYLADAEP